MVDLRLTETDWHARRNAHLSRLLPFAEERTQRMAKGAAHPVRDFLFDYYSYRPAELLRWSPGADVLLEEAKPCDIAWKEFIATDDGLILPASSFPEHRRAFLTWAINYFEAIRDRAPSFHCFGLHEWAMVYRAPEVRHARTPLRLLPSEIAAVVEREGVRCTHYDAFRFFTREAIPLNRLSLTRQDTAEHDQKGCLHVAMDLYRYAHKISPWCSGELIADTFELAWDARAIDMRASPYDLREHDYEPIEIETRDGREQYVELQRDLSRRGEPLRERLIGEYQQLANINWCNLHE